MSLQAHEMNTVSGESTDGQGMSWRIVAAASVRGLGVRWAERPY